MRKLTDLILIGIGITEMLWGKLLGPVRIEAFAAGMYRALGLQDGAPGVSRIFSDYIKAFQSMWTVVFWLGLATVILGVILLILEGSTRTADAERR